MNYPILVQRTKHGYRFTSSECLQLSAELVGAVDENGEALLRLRAEGRFQAGFQRQDLSALFPSWSRRKVIYSIAKFLEQGKILRVGRGASTRYVWSANLLTACESRR